MSAMSLPAEHAAAHTEEEPQGDGRPMLGITLGLLLSVPLWVGLWCASAWI